MPKTDLTKLALTRAKKKLMEGGLSPNAEKRLRETVADIKRWTKGIGRGNEALQRRYAVNLVTGPDVYRIPGHTDKFLGYASYVSPKYLTGKAYDTGAGTIASSTT